MKYIMAHNLDEKDIDVGVPGSEEWLTLLVKRIRL